MKKFIALILIIGLILPSIAQAGDWIGGPFQIPATIKDTILDPISKFAAKPFAKVLFYELGRLAKGEFTDAREPYAILDWGNFLNRASIKGVSMFTTKLDKTFDANDKFEKGMKTYLQALGFANQAQDFLDYSQYAKPTLKNDLEAGGKDYNSFIDSGYSLTNGGWTGYYSLMKPQNNAYGQIMMAERARAGYIAQAEESAKNEGISGGGFQNRSECLREGTKTVPDEAAQDNCLTATADCEESCGVEFKACDDNCRNLYVGADLQGCQSICESSLDTCQDRCFYSQDGCMAEATKEESSGICEEYRVQNVGSEIKKMVEKELEFDIDFLVSADELEDLFSMLMTNILGGKTQGPGWGTTQSSSTPSSWSYKPYKTTTSFYQLSKNPPSLEEREKARTEIVNIIYDAVGRLSRGVASCHAEEKRKQKGQMPENQERELTRLENQLLDFLESYVPELYLRETGIPLKTEFELLDPGNAPFKVYGKTWSEIPFNYYPAECAKFGQLCGDFNSQLPTWEDLFADCKTCLDAINKNSKKCKEDCGYNKTCLQGCTDDQATSQAIADKKCPPETIEIPPFQPGGPGGGGGGDYEEEHPPYMLQKEFSVLAQIVGDATFANTCNEKYRIIQNTKEACQDCIQAAEYTCETKMGATDEEISACIEEKCGEGKNENLFNDIARVFPELALQQSAFSKAIPERTCPTPWEPVCGEEGLPAGPEMFGRGKDFYDRCEIQEKKDACFMCLKQYFMPANYAMEVRDYIGRGFIKHPYLLVETFYSREDKDVFGEILKSVLIPFYGVAKLFKWIFGGGGDIEKYYEYHLNYCIGTCPEVMQSNTQCKNHSKDETVPVGLICRATPETPICSSCSNRTTDALDFLPSDADCQSATQKGAINPLRLISNAAFRHRSKYCRALVGHDASMYIKCSKAQGERPENPDECLSLCREERLECIRICRQGREDSGPCENDCSRGFTFCLDSCEEISECGDGACTGDETPTSCPEDCGTYSGTYCGDGACNPEDGETCSSCPRDCGQCPAVCGDGICTRPDETCDNCPADCGVCSTPTPPGGGRE